MSVYPLPGGHRISVSTFQAEEILHETSSGGKPVRATPKHSPRFLQVVIRPPVNPKFVKTALHYAAFSLS